MSDELEFNGWENSTWLDNLYIQRKEYVDNIRSYSEAQIDLWRKVPELAYNANGRGGWVDSWSRAYLNKLWAIRSSSFNGYYTVFVDLNTGKLVNVSYDNNLCEAREGCIIDCLPSDFDAMTIIKELQIEINKPVGDYFKPAYDEHIAHKELRLG